MSVTAVRGDASSSAEENDVDLKLEVVVIPSPMSTLQRSFARSLGGARCRLPFR
jgi:hypothetical protein